MKALFAVSLGNDLFSTENVSKALRAIEKKYDEMTFVIADRIQQYNRVVGLRDLKDLVTLMDRFERNEAFGQRKKWIERLRTDIGDSDRLGTWRLVGFDSMSDMKFTSALRNVRIAYTTIDAFRDDVNSGVVLHCQAKILDEQAYRRCFELSVNYILEEIAASVWLHVHHRIDDHYYMGRHLDVIVRLFHNKYAISPQNLATQYGNKCPVTFYGYSTTECTWSPLKDLHGAHE